MGVTESEKHFSLLRYGINYGRYNVIGYRPFMIIRHHIVNDSFDDCELPIIILWSFFGWVCVILKVI